MTKQELEKTIAEKEEKLNQAKQEMNSWNRGMYKNSSNASVSKLLVRSLEDEISKLRTKLLETG